MVKPFNRLLHQALPSCFLSFLRLGADLTSVCTQPHLPHSPLSIRLPPAPHTYIRGRRAKFPRSQMSLGSVYIQKQEMLSASSIRATCNCWESLPRGGGRKQPQRNPEVHLLCSTNIQQRETIVGSIWCTWASKQLQKFNLHSESQHRLYNRFVFKLLSFKILTFFFFTVLKREKK